MNIPLWALVHFPVIVTITTAMFTPKARPNALARPHCGAAYLHSSSCACWVAACEQILCDLLISGKQPVVLESCVCLPAWQGLLW